MDRRQKKTRQAVFSAFLSLLSEKSADKITVEEIIVRADIGRTTFYDHFETKEYLQKELCEELFCHLFDTVENSSEHHHIFSCNGDEPPFLHLLSHIKNNDNRIAELLTKQNGGVFSEYFKKGVMRLTKSCIRDFACSENSSVPEDYLVGTVTSVFTETVRWWLTDNKAALSPEAVAELFYSVTSYRKPADAVLTV